MEESEEFSESGEEYYEDDESSINCYYHYVQSASDASRLIADYLSNNKGPFSLNEEQCEWEEWVKDSTNDRELKKLAKLEEFSSSEKLKDRQKGESLEKLFYRYKLIENIKFFWLRKRSIFPFAHHKYLNETNTQYQSIMVNHTSGELNLTQKAMLVRTLIDYFGETGYFHFHPRTFIFSFTISSRKKDEHVQLLNADNIVRKIIGGEEVMEEFYKNQALIPNTWIFKPSTGSCGRGIKILNLKIDNIDQMSYEEFKIEIYHRVVQIYRTFREERSPEIIGQSYISNPFLYKNFKFDLRVYLLIASVKNPYISFCSREGYLRVCSDEYNSNFSNKNAHITNFHVQRDHPLYDPATDSIEGRTTRVEYAHFIDYLYANNYLQTLTDKEKEFFHFNDLPKDEKTMKDLIRQFVKTRIHTTVGSAVKSSVCKIQQHPLSGEGQFALLGVDLLLDVVGNFWLIEFTKSPAFRMHPEYLHSLHSAILTETVDIVMDIENHRESFGNVNIENVASIKNSTAWDLLLYEDNSQFVLPSILE